MGQTTILDNILQGDDISWQAMIMDAVKSHEMNPWDIDLSALAAEFLNRLKNLTEMNFKLSGKVVLASALLLKLKSQRFVSEDMTILDQLISSAERQDEEFLDDFSMDDESLESQDDTSQTEETYTLQKRTPQPRKRKVSVYDLIDALEQAIEVNKRRQIRNLPLDIPQVHIPQKQFDISSSMDLVHTAIKEYFSKNKHKPLTFSQLIPSKSRKDQIYTFIPLLHLSNSQQIDIHQDEHFGDFFIQQPAQELRQELQLDSKSL